MSDEPLLKTVYAAIDELNLQLPTDKRIGKCPDTVLWGPASALDSLSVLNLIIATEQRINEEFGASVVLTDDGQLFDANSPLTTVRSLVLHVETLLKSRNGN